MKKTINAPHLVLLILGLLFYTAIGFLFVIPNIPLRVSVFILLLFIANLRRQHYLIIAFVCTIGFFTTLSSDWRFVVLNVLSWGALVGSVVGSLLIYQKVFSGGDFASISKLFKNKNRIAIHSYYVFKIIPMITDLLDRLSKSYMIYGRKKYIGKKGHIGVKIIFDAVDSFFCELLILMFSQIRIMNRREPFAYAVSQEKRTVNLQLLIVQILIVLFVIIVFIFDILSYLLKIDLFN